jgi:death-on-curing protein
MKRISIEQIIRLHDKMIEATGGDCGIRDYGLLDSTLSNAYATFDGIELYQTIEEKCSSICFGIINNHPFIDGNKRMGMFVMLILLEYNNIKLTYTQRELIDLGLDIARGLIKQDLILKWIMEHENT